MQSLGYSLPHVCFRIICEYGPMQAAAPDSEKVMGRAARRLSTQSSQGLRQTALEDFVSLLAPSA